MALRPDPYGRFCGLRPRLAVLLPLATFAISYAQEPGGWVNLTNGDFITRIGGNAERIWATTNGGIFELEKDTGLRSFYTRSNSGLATNQPSSLHVATNGDLWVHQRDPRAGNNLVVFDGSAWTTPELPFQPVMMLTDNRGALWIQEAPYLTPNHFAMRDGSDWRLLEASSGLHGWYATGIVRDNAENSWFAILPRYESHTWAGGGLARYDGANWTTFTSANSPLSSNFISALALDLDGSLWLSYDLRYETGSRGGVSRYDGSTWAHFRTDNSGIPTESVHDLAIDHQGVKWLATAMGVVRFDGTDWMVFDRSNSDLPSNDVGQLYVDEDDVVWAGTQGAGLAGFSDGGWITHATSNSPFPYPRYNSTSQFSVTALKRAPDGSIWMGLFQDGGVLRVAGEEWVGYDTGNSSLPSDHVFDIAFETHGTAWIATPRGLAAFDGNEWRIYDASNSELRQDYARCVAVDPVSGSIWVGNQYGLAVFDGTTWTHYDQQNSGLPSNYIEALAIDGRGNVYVSTRNPGNFGILMRFDGATWVELLRTRIEVPGILVVDSNGSLWADWTGSESSPQGGIVRIDGMDRTFFNTLNSGLPEVPVTSLAHDGQNLWVGTRYHGVVRFDGERWDIFDITNSGIAQNGTNSIAVGADGRVWIGGLGLSIYRPQPPVPVLVQNLRAEPLPGKIRLTWELPKNHDVIGVEVDRAETPGGPYVRRTPHGLDPSESMEYEDTELSAEIDYWYRVVLLETNGTRTSSFPVGATLRGLRAKTILLVPFQPSSDLVELRYTIGGPRVPVRFEIFDVAGRLVTSLDQGFRGTGDYVQPWHTLDASGRSVASGMYIVRLIAGSERVMQKLVLVR